MRKLFWLKLVFICLSYSKNKSGVRFSWTRLKHTAKVPYLTDRCMWAAQLLEPVCG